MAKKGLNETGRRRISSLVTSGASGERVRKEIDLNVQGTDFNYDKNLELASWMRDRKYAESADLLARYLRG